MVLEKERKKKTRIVCTIGPASEDKKVLTKLVQAGMNVMRLNFSHGDFEEHGGRIKTLREINKELNKNVAILLDTKGPEIRTGDFVDGKTEFKKGQVSTICVEDIVGTSERFTITYKDLYKDVKPGGFILVNDGQVELLVDHVEGTDIVCICANDGIVKNKRGINVPGIKLGFDYLSEKDIGDLTFGCQQGVDFIAASFVRNAEAIKEIKELLRANGGERIDVIAKIENAEGVHNIDKIIKAADGVMVARGDLGVEIPAHEVPHIQKMIIRKCNESYKPVITATQMLDSMMRAPRPTRAEVTDVANAIYDGTDAIMLSGETAMGKYPEQAVQMMVKIAECTEPYMTHKRFLDYRALRGNKNVSSAVGVAAVQTTENLGADCIVTPTISGQTARLISNFRPKVPIYAVSPNEWARRKMQIYWGVTSVAGYEEDSTENIISHAMYIVRRENLVKKGDIVVFTAGDPATNMVNGEGAVTNIMQVIQAK